MDKDIIQQELSLLNANLTGIDASITDRNTRINEAKKLVESLTHELVHLNGAREYHHLVVKQFVQLLEAAKTLKAEATATEIVTT